MLAAVVVFSLFAFGWAMNIAEIRAVAVAALIGTWIWTAWVLKGHKGTD
jgi:hypothetical protein